MKYADEHYEFSVFAWTSAKKGMWGQTWREIPHDFLQWKYPSNAWDILFFIWAKCVLTVF